MYRRNRIKDLEFYFDRVFDCNSSNEAVFEGTTEDLVRFCWMVTTAQ